MINVVRDAALRSSGGEGFKEEEEKQQQKVGEQQKQLGDDGIGEG